MSDYKKLVEKLRYCGNNPCSHECEWWNPERKMEVWSCVGANLTDAAAAIEALQAEVKRLEDELSFSESSADEFQMQAALQNALLVKQIPHWVSVEEPPQSGQECFTAYRSILRSEHEWLYDICYYADDLARDCPLMDGAEHRPGWHRYESEYGDVECHPKYWMPIEPPQEVQDGTE